MNHRVCIALELPLPTVTLPGFHKDLTTTAAALAGISTQDIMNRASWSRESTVCQFYYKPSEKTAFVQRFTHTKAVLANSINKAKDMLIEPEPSKYN